MNNTQATVNDSNGIYNKIKFTMFSSRNSHYGMFESFLMQHFDGGTFQL